MISFHVMHTSITNHLNSELSLEMVLITSLLASDSDSYTHHIMLEKYV